MLPAHWQPIFAESPVDSDAMEAYLQYAVPVPHYFSWDISVEDMASALHRTTDSARGPDGIPYVAWSPLMCDELAPTLPSGLVELGSDAESLLPGAYLLTMVFLPKAAPLGEAATFNSEVAALRPRLRRLSPKLLPSRSMAASRRGRSARPWPTREALWPSSCALAFLRMRATRQLCAECGSLMPFPGEVVVMHNTSGNSQGCLMSGSLFALSADPCLRCVLMRSLVGLIRLTDCAGDLAIAFSRIWHDLARYARVPAAGIGVGASSEPRQARLRALVAVFGQRRSRCALRGVPRAGCVSGWGLGRRSCGGRRR